MGFLSKDHRSANLSLPHERNSLQQVLGGNVHEAGLTGRKNTSHFTTASRDPRYAPQNQGDDTSKPFARQQPPLEGITLGDTGVDMIDNQHGHKSNSQTRSGTRMSWSTTTHNTEAEPVFRRCRTAVSVGQLDAQYFTPPLTGPRANNPGRDTYVSTISPTPNSFEPDKKAVHGQIHGAKIVDVDLTVDALNVDMEGSKDYIHHQEAPDCSSPMGRILRGCDSAIRSRRDDKPEVHPFVKVIDLAPADLQDVRQLSTSANVRRVTASSERLWASPQSSMHSKGRRQHAYTAHESPRQHRTRDDPGHAELSDPAPSYVSYTSSATRAGFYHELYSPIYNVQTGLREEDASYADGYTLEPDNDIPLDDELGDGQYEVPGWLHYHPNRYGLEDEEGIFNHPEESLCEETESPELDINGVVLDATCLPAQFWRPNRLY